MLLTFRFLRHSFHLFSVLHNLGDCAEPSVWLDEEEGDGLLGLYQVYDGHILPPMALIFYLFPRLAQSRRLRFVSITNHYSLSCWLAYLPLTPTPLISMLSQRTWAMVSKTPDCPESRSIIPILYVVRAICAQYSHTNTLRRPLPLFRYLPCWCMR